MICVIAGDYEEARRWARSQMLAANEWFYPDELADLLYLVCALEFCFI